MNYGGPTAAFWTLLPIRLILAAIWVGIPVLLVGAWVWWTTSRRGAPQDDRARRTRTTRLRGLGIGAIVGVLAVWLTDLWLAPVFVAAGYLLGVLNGELRTLPPRTGDVRIASLQPRTALRYAPRWAVLVSVTAAALTTFAPIVLLAVPTPSYGPWQPFPGVAAITLPGRHLAWPSPADWVPLALVACGALIGGALLIRRALRLPADTADQPGLAEPARRNAARTITGTVTGIELLALGAQTIFTSDGLAVPDVIGGTPYTISRILIWSGVALVAAGILVWCVLASWRKVPADHQPT